MSYKKLLFKTSEKRKKRPKYNFKSITTTKTKKYVYDHLNRESIKGNKFTEHNLSEIIIEKKMNIPLQKKKKFY